MFVKIGDNIINKDNIISVIPSHDRINNKYLIKCNTTDGCLISKYDTVNQRNEEMDRIHRQLCRI